MKLHTLGNNYRRIAILVFLIVMAAILLVVGIIVGKCNKKDYAETTATIVEIIQNGADEDMTYEVYVDYTVDGTPYNHVKINTYESSYKVGKTITILYNPANPAQIVGKTASWLPIVLFIGAGVFAALFVVMIVLTIRAKGKTKELKANPTLEQETDRTIGEPQKLYFAWDTKTPVKQRFYLEDEGRNLLYEGKMTKFNPVGAHTYLFTDHLRHTETEHKVGHVNSAGGEYTTVSQGFTFDDIEMTEYLDANHISVHYGVGQGVSMAFDIYMGDKLIAQAQSSSRYMHEDEQEAHPTASKFRLNQFFYTIDGQPSYADVIFLVLFKEATSPRMSSLLG